MPGDDKSDDKLGSEELALLRAGDREAWGRVYGSMKRPVIAFICHKGVRHTDAEDIYQEVFLSVLKSFTNDKSHYDGRGSLQGYLLTTARNKVINFLIQGSGNREAPPDTGREADGSNYSIEELPDSQPGPEVLLEEKEFKEIIESMIRALPPAERDVSRLKFLEEWQNREIAEILGITMNNVRVRASRACETLRKSLLSVMRPEERDRSLRDAGEGTYKDVERFQ